MTQDHVRYLIAAAAIGFVVVRSDLAVSVLGGADKPVAAAYDGPLREAHAAARKMAPEHRAALSQALEQASQSTRNDTLGLIATTGQWQRAMQGALQFGYRDGGRVDTLYPDVAAALQAELSRAAGPDDAKVLDRARLADCALELAKAVR